MTNLQLFELFSDIDERYVISATRPAHRFNVSKWTKIGGVAACLCLVIAGMFAVSSRFADRSLPHIEQEQTTVATDDTNGEVTQNSIATTVVTPPTQITETTTNDVTTEALEAPGESPGEVQTTADKMSENLPMIIFNSESISAGGMGFEGLMYYDINEAENGNPWNEETPLATLPVYKNLGYSYYAVENYLDSEDMIAKVRETAEILGIQMTDWDFGTVFSQIGENEFLDGTRYVDGIADNVTIRAYANGGVYVKFEGGVDLPDEYSFTHYGTAHDDALTVLEYLCEKYSELLGYAEAECVTVDGDYNIYGVRKRDYIAYDSSDDYMQDILNYNFNSAEFVPEFGEFDHSSGENEDTGDLGSISRSDGLICAEKLGDYPLISVGKAEKLLFAGNYYSSVPHDIVSTDTVAKVELVYTSGVTSEYFMPVYKFYIELSGTENGHNFDRDNRLKTFGVYYVPAVSGEYIADMPTNAGRFN